VSVSVLEELDSILENDTDTAISEGRRISFFEGKRKGKDGITRKTGHHYWQWDYKDPDTGKRKRPYGGPIATTPQSRQYRASQYQERNERNKAANTERDSITLAERLFRPAGVRVQSGDTGEGREDLPSD
jgi:hypothetical protein